MKNYEEPSNPVVCNRHVWWYLPPKTDHALTISRKIFIRKQNGEVGVDSDEAPPWV
jgi:hypothetical protein